MSELQELCKLCDERDTDVRITTKKLAMVSLLTVFKDIVPGWVCCNLPVALLSILRLHVCSYMYCTTRMSLRFQVAG